jgi:hypothetical protein
MPAKGEIAAITPIIDSSPPIADINKGKTGFFEIVVEKIAKKPIVHKNQIAWEEYGEDFEERECGNVNIVKLF